MKSKKILSLILSTIIAFGLISQTATQAHAAKPHRIAREHCSDYSEPQIPVLKSSVSRSKRLFSKKYSKEKDIFTSQSGLSFRITKNNEVILANIKKELEHVIIPKEVEISKELYRVTSIGNEVFKNNTVIKSIHIPDSITDIDECTFYNCCNLESIFLPKNLTEIGEMAFKNCTNLQLTELPDSVSIIGNSAFEGCSNIALTYLPSGIKTQPEVIELDGVPQPTKEQMNDPLWWHSVYASLKQTIPGTSVPGIGDYVFKDCTNLRLTELPKNITKIGEGAFENCINLQLTELPDSVTQVSILSFRNCWNLLRRATFMDRLAALSKKISKDLVESSYSSSEEYTSSSLSETSEEDSSSESTINIDNESCTPTTKNALENDATNNAFNNIPETLIEEEISSSLYSGTMPPLPDKSNFQDEDTSENSESDSAEFGVN